jgi:hypothetical protein
MSGPLATGRVASRRYPPARPQTLPMPPAREGARWRAVAVVVSVGVVLAFVWTMLVGNYNQFGAALIAMALLLLTIPLARHAARVEAWPALGWIVMAASVLRLGGAVARYHVTYGVYSGVADASTYTTVASQHYKAFRHYHFFWPNTGVFHGLIPWLDTIIYSLFGPTQLGAFLVFSWISLIGTYLFYRAFRIGYPEGDGRRYAALAFFLPSMMYWPSSLGKEAWMVLSLGLASYGVARALAGRVGGYVSLAAGVGGMLLVRPHLGLIFLPAAVIAFVLRRTTPGRRRPIGRLVGIAVLVVCCLAVVGKAQSYFGITNLDVQSVTKQLNTTRQQTDIGSSAFNPPNARSPLGYPEAVVTVLFRPFPWEAHSLTVRVASLEGVLLVCLTVASWRRLRGLPRALWENPYVTYAFVYSALFVLAFSNFANFGILARQRVQLLPLFLVLLSMPTDREEAAAAKEPRTGAAPRMATSPAVPSQSPEAQGRPVPAQWKLRTYGRPRREPRYAPSHQRAVTLSPGRPLGAGSYQALDYGFRVEVTGTARAGEARNHVVWALRDLAAVPAGEHVYRLTVEPGSEGDLVAVARDGATMGAPASLWTCVDHLVADVTQGAIASRPDQLLLHAAALSFAGHGLLLPGPSGSGKSTLAAALVLAGFDYLTDEAAAIDPETLEMAPYPKPLSLRAGSAQRLRITLPALGHMGSPDLAPCSVLRAHSRGRQVPVRVMLFPRYDPAATSELAPMGRAEAFVEVANNSFNFVDHGGQWMDLLRRLVTRCWCGRLNIGDIDGVPALVRSLLLAQGGSTV